MQKPVRVGIIGCGRIVQSVHAAALAGLRGLLATTAVCDVDESARQAVGDRLGARYRFAAWEDLVACGDVDAVLVATSDHVAPALGALAAGRHLLVEKPLCFDIAAGRELVRAAELAGVVSMIGYMKRYDWCFERACELLGQLGTIRIARVHDFACRFDKSDDLFAFPPRAAGANALSRLELLLMFASHDLSIVRGALGDPDEVLFVHAPGPATLCIGLRCPRAPLCLLEISLDTRYEWFDETITMHGDEAELGVRFADPFVPYAPSRLWHRRAERTGTLEERVAGPFEDAFRREWVHFAGAIAGGAAPRTPLAVGLADIELAELIVARWPDTPAVGG